jgi:hypothetical protein
MSLKERLDRIRQGFEKQAPAKALAIMHRATDDLRQSGVADRALKEGQPAPGFELKDSNGSSTSLAALLQQGPVVLTFFRGKW